MNALPMCDDLFLKFFDPWYNDEERRRRPFKGVFPDIMRHSYLIGCSQSEIGSVMPESQDVIISHITAMVDAARGDLKADLEFDGEIDLSWVDAFDQFSDRPRIQDLIDQSNPKERGNGYLIICCEFGAAMSHVLKNMLPRLIWQLELPYWDSCLVDPKTGSAMPVFHWAIKKMSEYGVDDGYAAKIKACVQLLNDERKLGQILPP